MDIRHRIIFLIVLTFVAVFSIGAYAILQSGWNASAVNAVTEGMVPSALATADLVSKLKDVQLGAVTLVTASGQDLADQDLKDLNKRKGLLEEAVHLQLKQADGDKQRGLVRQAQESLKTYFEAIDEVVSFKLAGKKELAEASLFANVAEYQNELGTIVETLRVEKNRSTAGAIRDLDGNLARATMTIAWVTVLTVVLLSTIGALLCLQINRPLMRIQSEIAAIKGNLDLSRRIAVVGKNEIDRVAVSVNSLLDEFQTIVRGVQNAGQQVSHTSDELSHSVGQLLTAIEQQNEATSSVAVAVEEMAVSVTHVSNSAATAQGIAQMSLSEAKNGGEAIDATVREMVRMTDVVQGTSCAMEELGKRTQEIGGIAEVIKSIADQTNLLALNAAIEAARAGETGRGFAVVADEVRKLAERTSGATADIGAVINVIQEQTRNAVANMVLVVSHVRSNTAAAHQAGTSIAHIREGSIRVVDVGADIASALTEQSATSEIIARQVEKIASMSEGNTVSMGQTREASTKLKCLSADMHRLAERFRT